MTLPAVRGPERKEIALQGALEHLAPGPWLERPDAPDAIVTAVRRLPPVDARYSPFPQWLDPRLQAAFERRGVTQLYCHQAEALSHVAAGRNIVVTTPTASGKTLCYNLPVLDAVLQNPAQCARCISSRPRRWRRTRWRRCRASSTRSATPPASRSAFTPMTAIRRRTHGGPSARVRMSCSPTRTCCTRASCRTIRGGRSCSRTCASS